jgi:hypothetical protein
MVPLSAGLSLFFSQKDAQSILQENKTRKQRLQAPKIVALLQLFQWFEAFVEQGFQLRGHFQLGPAMGAIQVVGMNDLRATVADADFHPSTLARFSRQLKKES